MREDPYQVSGSSKAATRMLSRSGISIVLEVEFGDAQFEES
jgi:hypothetical protein